jgi:uncharacterized protein (DUF433 family)
VQHFERISANPEVMGGKPCIRGMRVTVGIIVEALAAGRSADSLLADFPYLKPQDIREALAYAASLAQGREFPPRELMRLLSDMNLTIRWVQQLLDAGHEAVHWSTIGQPTARMWIRHSDQ